MIKFLMTVLVTVSMATPVLAAPGCYAPDEAEAEQGLRLQNEMLLVGMACGQGTNYKNFVEAHKDLWQDYEETLKAFFKTKLQSPNPKQQLEALEVQISNEAALRMAQISRPLYCRMHRKTFGELKNKTNEQLRVKLRLAPEHSTLSKPRCKE